MYTSHNGGYWEGYFTTATLEASDTITVTIKYLGSTSTIPKSVNLNFVSQLTYKATTAETIDYFGAKPVDLLNGEGPLSHLRQLSNKLVHVDLDASGKGSFTYAIAAKITCAPGGWGAYAQYPYIAEIDYGFNANVDSRSVSIGVPGHDANNMRKAYTKFLRQAQVKNAAGDLVDIGDPYEVAAPAPQLPASGIVDYHRDIDLGLKLDKEVIYSNSNGGLDTVDPDPIHLTYTPLVTQLFQPDEHYAWGETLKGINASADLPRTITVQYPAWTIENLTADYRQPLLSSAYSYGLETNRTYFGGDRAKDDTVSLHYAWND